MAEDTRINRAEQDLGMGQPPPANPDGAQEMIADECNTNAKVVVVEEAAYTLLTPIADADVLATLGNSINVWGVTDNIAPRGVQTATNTLTAPTMPNSNMIIRGIQIAVRVEPEGRTIKGNFFNPAGVSSIPMSPDAMSANDQAGGVNGPLGLAVGQGLPLECELLWGLSTWKAALGFILGYQLNWFKDNQNSLLKDPLTSIGCIEPFSEAMAAGTALGSNLDRIREFNDRMLQIGDNRVMLPITHKRLGSLTVAGPTNVGDFEISREDDASPTVFGGVGTPGNSFRNKPPFIFNTPMFWPLGQPLGMKFDVYNEEWQQYFQRWITLTGSVKGGQDLSLAIAQQFAAGAGATGFAPTALGTNTALEQTLDLSPVNTGQQVQTKRAILKGGRMVISVAIIGRRIQEKWKPAVKAAINAGAIQAPMGMGNL